MCEIVGKIDGGEELEYEWKKKGLKIQYQTANKVLKKCRSASSALKADQYQKAQDFLQEGILLLSNRIKHLRIADQSPNGWETVAHYERKDIAIDDQDDKKMRKAERDAQEASNLRQNSRRGHGMYRGRFRPPFQPYDSSSRQMYRAMGPFRGGNQWNQGVALPDNRRRARPSDTCFFCGKLGHWQVDCPEKANRKCECYDEAVYDNSDIYYFDYLEHSENGYVSPENVFAYCHSNACQIRSASDHFNEVMTSNYRCNARCAFCDNVK